MGIITKMEDFMGIHENYSAMPEEMEEMEIEQDEEDNGPDQESEEITPKDVVNRFMEILATVKSTIEFDISKLKQKYDV